MKTDISNKQLTELLSKSFTLLTPGDTKKTSFKMQFRVSGYNDLMHYISSTIKVCILALEGQDVCGSHFIPEPNVNISTVLELLLSMVPYEESELLDELHLLHLKSQEPKPFKEMSIREMNFFLTPPIACA